MATIEVETFEIEEMNEEQTPEEMDAEAIALVEAMELDGQKSLHTAGPDGQQSRLPYPKMSTEEFAVYHALFPAEKKIEAYDAGIIPVRVLKLAQEAKEKHGYELMVWAARVFNPDPVLVGKKNNAYYLLARWGTALVPYKQLLVEARAAIRKDLKMQATSVMARVKAILDDLDGTTEKKLAGEWVHVG